MENCAMAVLAGPRDLQIEHIVPHLRRAAQTAFTEIVLALDDHDPASRNIAAIAKRSLLKAS
jgi:hypothetical protein